MTTHKVHLAEAPTDVLCWLAQRPGESFTPAEVAKAVAPPDADNPWLSTLDALHLLRDGLYVSERMNRWEVTVEGRAAVVEAMTPAHAKARTTEGSEHGREAAARVRVPRW